MSEKKTSDWRVERRWTPLLAQKFCPVASPFLEYYHRFKLNSTEAMLIIHLMEFKWDEKAPFPTVGTLATRMGITRRAVRNALKSLEEEPKALLKREATLYGPNRYDMTPLFEKLEKIVSEEKSKSSSEEAA